MTTATLPIFGRDRLQFLRFLVAGGLSVPVNLAARVLFSRYFSYESAILLSHVCGMLTAYALNRLFVFEQSGRGTASELVRFALVNVVSALQTWLVAVALVRIVFPRMQFHHAPELVAHVIALASSAVTSFFGHRFFSFARA